MNYVVEFLNFLTISGLPPRKLVLKVNCIVLLIRNLNTTESLVNETRMRIKCVHRNAIIIDCEDWDCTGTENFDSMYKFNILWIYFTI